MEEIIRQLRMEKESLLIRVNKIDNAIASLESLDQSNTEKEPKTLMECIPTVKTKPGLWKKKPQKEKHKQYEKRKENKWSPEVFDFVRKNLHLKNKEIEEAINKKFKIGTTEGSLGVQMAHQGIKRDKKTKETVHNSVKKKIEKTKEGPVKKHKCEECHENVWVAWYEGKQLCQECFDMKKGKRKKKPEGMTNKEINKSMKEIGASDEEDGH